MDLKDRINYAMTLAGLSAAQVAKETGKTPGAVSQWLSGTVKGLKAETAQAIAKATGVDAYWLITGDGPMPPTHRPAPVAIDLDNNLEWPAVRRVSVKAQAGVTGYAIEAVEDLPPIVFRADWYKLHGYRPERLMALRVAGESMVPSLWPDDLIVVNTEATTPKDGTAMLVTYYGEVTVKRLQRDAGEWWLASDNPDQRRYARKLCDESTVIVGEVVYKQSERV